MGAQAWATAFCSDDEDVQMVRDSILAIVYTFDPTMPLDNLAPDTKLADLENHFGDQAKGLLQLIDKLDEDGWEGQTVAVAKASSRENSPKEHTSERTNIVEHVKDLFEDYGIEVVDMLDKGVKDGERQGLARLTELLETHIALSGVPVESEISEMSAAETNDPLQEAIENIMTNGDSKAIDTAKIDKTLKDSGFAFPLLENMDGNGQPRGETDIEVGDMESLVKKIRLARTSKSTMEAEKFQTLINEIARDLAKFI